MKITKQKLSKILHEIGLEVESLRVTGEVAVDNDSYSYILTPDSDAYIRMLEENDDDTDLASDDGHIEVCGREIYEYAGVFDFGKIFENDLFKLKVTLDKEEIGWNAILD